MVCLHSNTKNAEKYIKFIFKVYFAATVDLLIQIKHTKIHMTKDLLKSSDGDSAKRGPIYLITPV